jgi:hypothetical protein
MNNILSRLLTVALLGLAFHAVAATPDVPVSGTAPTPAPLQRRSPSSASNGDGFFVAWVDWRSGAPSIVGTRVTRDGRVLDPFGIRLDWPRVRTDAVQVVWDGGAYLVVWNGDENVYAARVNLDGHIVMAPRVIATNASIRGKGSAASNGNRTAIVYSSGELSTVNRVAVLDRNGNTVGDEKLSGVALVRGEYTIAANASRFVVAWRSSISIDYRYYTIEAVALDANGRVDGPPVIIGSGERPAIASDGTNFTIAWLKYVNAGRLWRVETRTVDASLAGGTVREVMLAGDIDPLSIVWRSDHYEIVTTTREYPQPADFHITSIELAPDGTPIDTNSYGMVSWWEHDVSAATNGAELLVTTLETPTDPRHVRTHIVARLVRGSLESAPQLLSWSGNTQRNPRVATSPYGSLVVWEEDDGWYMARLDPQGTSHHDRGIPLLTSADVRVAFNGTHYVFAINERNYIALGYIDPRTGADVAYADIFLDQPAEDDIALAASPAATYVVFNDGRIRVSRIPHTSDFEYFPDPAIAVSPEGMWVDYPALASNGSELLVAWNEIYSIPRCDPGPCLTSINVYAARLSAGLTLLDPAPLLLAQGEEGWGDFGPPSIASNGADWLAVMRHDLDIIATRVLQNGTLPNATPVQIASNGDQPVATWDGERYIVAWKEDDGWLHERPLFAAAIPEHGELAPMRRTLITNKAASSVPSIVGETIAYTKHSFRIEHGGVERTFLRALDLSGAPRGRTVRR